MKHYFIFTLLFLVACSSGGGLGAGGPSVPAGIGFSVSATQAIGPQGGTMTGPVGSDIEGLVLEIPAGAVDAETPIQVGVYDKTKQPQNPESSELGGKFFYFGPSGTKFKKPITVTMPYSPKSKQTAALKEALEGANPDFGKQLAFLIYDEANQHWESVPCDPDPVMITCKGVMDHFSGGGVGAAHVTASLRGINRCADPVVIDDDLFITTECDRVVLDGGVGIVGNNPPEITQYSFQKLAGFDANANRYEVVSRSPNPTLSFNVTIDNQDQVEGIYTMVAENAQGLPVARSNPVFVSVDIIPGCENDNGAVVFPDDNLKRAVLGALGLPLIANPTVAQMRNLINLNADRRAIGNLKGLECAIHMQNLVLTNNFISDITPLGHLRRLRTLSLSNNNIVDVGPLVGLDVLTFLTLDHNSLANINSLPRTVGGYAALALNDNRITDLRRLGGLTFKGLAFIGLQHNPMDLSIHSANRQIIDRLVTEGHVVEWDELSLDFVAEGDKREVRVDSPPKTINFEARVAKNDRDNTLTLDHVDFFYGQVRQPARNLFQTVQDGNEGRYTASREFADPGKFGVSAMVTSNYGSYARIHVSRQVDVFVQECKDELSDLMIGHWCSINEDGPIVGEILPVCSDFSTQFIVNRVDATTLGGNVAVLVCENQQPEHAITCVEDDEEENEVVVHFRDCLGLWIGFHGEPSKPLTLHFTKDGRNRLVNGYMSESGWGIYYDNDNKGLIMERRN